ncbi:MAG: amidohydrolase/deacetylase family metallohydrolase [Candidatus Latescibacterota bacterium]
MTPVRFIACIITVFTIQSGYAPAQNLLLRGGHVIDPANSIDSIMDVAIAEGKIGAVGRNIPPSDGMKVIDVSGYYVSPGFIDIHVHSFVGHRSNLGVDAGEVGRRSGTTTVVDAGTSGANEFGSFKKIIDLSPVRMLAFLNIAASGMNVGENNLSQFIVPLAVITAQRYPDTIVGFKTAHYSGYTSTNPPWASVDSVLAAGRRAGLPCMFDVTPMPAKGAFVSRTTTELLERMRPGDILSHCYHRKMEQIQADGTLLPSYFKARERGVIFDVGHGSNSFSFNKAIPATEQGFPPNSISTDLHSANINGPVYNLVNVMSKFLAMGYPLADIIRRSTINPALEINRPDLGSLTIGHTADIALFKEVAGEYIYTDSVGEKLAGKKTLTVYMTIYGGKVIFDPEHIYEKAPVSIKTESPPAFELRGNFPNPFNAHTTIEFELAEKGNIGMLIYNSLGQKVKTLINESKLSGRHSVIWDGTTEEGITASSGIYFVILRSKQQTDVLRIHYLK